MAFTYRMTLTFKKPNTRLDLSFSVGCICMIELFSVIVNRMEKS